MIYQSGYYIASYNTMQIWTQHVFSKYYNSVDD